MKYDRARKIVISYTPYMAGFDGSKGVFDDNWTCKILDCSVSGNTPLQALQTMMRCLKRSGIKLAKKKP